MCCDVLCVVSSIQIKSKSKSNTINESTPGDLLGTNYVGADKLSS